MLSRSRHLFGERVRSAGTYALKPLIAFAVLLASILAGLRSSLTVLGLLFSAAGALALLQRPALSLPALVVLSIALPLEMGTGSVVRLTPPVFLIPLMVGVWLAAGLRDSGKVRLLSSRTVLPLLLFASSGLLSLGAGLVYWDPAVPRSPDLLLVQLAQWAIFALSAAIFVLAGDLGRDARWLRYATWAFLGVAAFVLLVIYAPNVKVLLGPLDPSRAGTTSMFWTWLGGLLAGQLFFNRRLAHPARLGLLVLLAASAHVVWFLYNEWTSSLGPYTVAVLVVGWLWLWRRHRGAAVAAVVLAAVLTPAVFFPIAFERSGGYRELRYSWGGRMVLYRSVLDLVKDHPFLGLGPAAYRHYGFVRPLAIVGGFYYVQPNLNSHNNYIDIYAQQGLLGLGLFLWFLIELGLVGWRLRTRFQGDFADGYVHGALGGLAGTMVAMMLVDWFLPFVYNVGFPGFRTSALAWMFLGGLVALEQSTPQELDLPPAL